MVIIDSPYKKSPAPYPMVPSPTPYDLMFSHNTSVMDNGSRQPCPTPKA